MNSMRPLPSCPMGLGSVLPPPPAAAPVSDGDGAADVDEEIVSPAAAPPDPTALLGEAMVAILPTCLERPTHMSATP